LASPAGGVDFVRVRRFPSVEIARGRSVNFSLRIRSVIVSVAGRSETKSRVVLMSVNELVGRRLVTVALLVDVHRVLEGCDVRALVADRDTAAVGKTITR
jgi:hypothetical protein